MKCIVISIFFFEALLEFGVVDATFYDILDMSRICAFAEFSIYRVPFFFIRIVTYKNCIVLFWLCLI